MDLSLGLRCVPLMLVTSFAACEAATGPTRAEIAAIAVEPESAALHVGDEVRLQATVLAASGQLLPERRVFWSSEHPAIATVSAAGDVTAVTPGTTRIAASAAGKDAVAEVRITLRPVGAVVLAPDSLRITAGQSGQFQATVQDDRGTVVTGRELRWTSSAPATATVDGSGRVHGVGPGMAIITAESGGRSASRPVRIVPGPPAQLEVAGGDGQEAPAGSELPLPLTVQVRDANGHSVPAVRVIWEVQTGDGTVSPASSDTDSEGRASTRWRVGPRPGAQRVGARISTLEPAIFTAQVTGGRPARLVVEPSSAELDAIDATVDLHATAVDEFGNPVTAANFVWSSLTTTIATVDADGRVRARGNGVAGIVAAIEGVADTATVRVQQLIDAIRVEPRSATVHAAGGSVQLSATARDRNGHAVPAASVGWTSQDPTIATVDASGRVTGLAPGTTSIRASAAGRHDDATITVGVREASDLRIVSGDRQTGARGAVLPEPLVVEATDRQGDPVPGVSVAWSADRGGTITPSLAVTGTDGRAAVEWRLGNPPVRQFATAIVQGTDVSVTFRADPR